MMNFMNPNTGPYRGVIPTFIPGFYMDGEKTVIMLTSLVGGFMSILATLIPVPLMNIKRVKISITRYTEALDGVWTDSINYICSTQQTAKVYQIAQRITALGVNM